MSPLPDHLIDRWKDRPEPAPGHGAVYWHVLLGHDPQVRAIARQAQERLATFRGLHMTPLKWLHMTVLAAGPARDTETGALAHMLDVASQSLSDEPPVSVSLGKILYHPEAIVLAAQPVAALTPLREAAQKATRLVGHGRAADRPTDEPSQAWFPHVTLCYSTMRQPAGPIVAALGRELPSCTVSIDALSLVIQRGAERDWDWRPVGTACLLGSPHN